MKMARGRQWIWLVVVAGLSIGLIVTTATGQSRTQSDIAEDLRQYYQEAERRDSQPDVVDLLHEVSSISVGEREPELRGALIDALRADLASRRMGVWTRTDHETAFFLLQSVVEMEDPTAIPAIAQSMGFGLIASRALIAFGRDAADHVLDVVASPETTDVRIVAGGLLTLRMMVERARSGDEMYEAWLDQETRSRLRDLAFHHLSPAEVGSVLDVGVPSSRYASLVRAIDLAFVLQDDELNEMLFELVYDRRRAGVVLGVEGRQMDDQIDQIGRVQRRARERLNGSVPLPRR